VEIPGSVSGGGGVNAAEGEDSATFALTQVGLERLHEDPVDQKNRYPREEVGISIIPASYNNSNNNNMGISII
jgi:hypothetical protein